MADFSPYAVKSYYIIEVRTAWSGPFDLHTCESVMDARLSLASGSRTDTTPDRCNKEMLIFWDCFSDDDWSLATVTRILEFYFRMKTWIKSHLHVFPSCYLLPLQFIYLFFFPFHNRYSSVGIVTWSRAGMTSGQDISLFFTASRPALSLIQPPIQWIPRALSSRDKDTTHRHLVPRLRMGGNFPPLPRTFSRCGA
jgi:hypothetical protein